MAKIFSASKWMKGSRTIVFVPANLSYCTCLQICTVCWHTVYYRQDRMVLGKSGLLLKGTWLWPWSRVCVCVFFFYLFINIQHAPLHSNTTCFTVKYSQYGYIYLQFMYNFSFSIDTVSLLLVFLCIAYCFFILLSTALLTK